MDTPDRSVEPNGNLAQGAAEAAVLRGDDSAAKLALFEALGGDLDETFVPEVIALLERGDDPEVLAAAAISLGPMLEMCDDEVDDDGVLAEGIYGAPVDTATYQRMLAVLQRLHADPGAAALVRRRALEAAVRSPQDWHTEAIATAWRSDDLDWRVTAVFCMGCLYREDFSAEIAEALHADSPELRFEAIRAAGQRGLTELLPSILPLATDDLAPIDHRYVAVEALAMLGGDHARAAIERVAGADEGDLSEYAAEMLSDMNALDLDDLDDLEGFEGLEDLDEDDSDRW